MRTAHHEAGHAVIGYRFGLGLADVTIKPGKNRNGFVGFWKEFKTTEQEALTLLAGHAAQKYFHPDDKSEPSISDYRRLWSITESMQSVEYRELFLTVDRLVAENETQIQAVAEALLECETLEAGLFACIIDDVDSGLDWRKNKALGCFKEYAGLD